MERDRDSPRESELEVPGPVFCVVCGESVKCLYNKYGPSVLKVTNCGRCGSVADKYIEYDPVIIMLDMILLSKEAYRHVLFNTSFKLYWKLFILILFMESYLSWSRKLIHKDKPICTITTNNDSNHFNFHSDKPYESCSKNIEESDPFIMEKGIYVAFCCVCCGMLTFVISNILLSIFMAKTFNYKRQVKLDLIIKMITIGGLGYFLLLPTLIWGNENDKYIHYALVYAYIMLSTLTVHSVVFECNKVQSAIIFILSWTVKISVINYLKDVYDKTAV